ncbi:MULTISPECIES: hypothetical protein [unclassified Empedobacter]|uniref:hypothetical protein n=1 Tax=unclassified Empedobacter TaxID=2643773 RepID=UPI0025B995BD|nr:MULTISPECIES: hypothetical protein [unclassified Empedobacter]
MKLISMTDFVLEQTELLYEKNQSKLIHRVVNYAQFLKQPSKLGMFVPCDEEGNVLEEPTMEKYGYYFSNHQEEQSGWMYEEGEDEYYKVLEKYQQAKERVLFEGFSVYKNLIKNINGDNIMTWYIEARCIEDLILMNLTLTQTAIKQIGL